MVFYDIYIEAEHQTDRLILEMHLLICNYCFAFMNIFRGSIFDWVKRLGLMVQ